MAQSTIDYCSVEVYMVESETRVNDWLYIKGGETPRVFAAFTCHYDMHWGIQCYWLM